MFLSALLAVAVPALVAGAALAAARGRRWGGALAAGAAFVAGGLLVAGVPAFPPPEASPALLWLALLAAAAGAVEGAVPRPVRWGLRALVAASVAVALLSFLVGTGRRFAAWGEAAPWMAGSAAAIFALGAALDAWAARHETGPAAPLALGIVAAGGGGALFLSGSALLAQQTGALGAAAGAAFLVALARPGWSGARGATAVAAALLPGLWLAGYFYSDLPAASALLLAAAPLAAWVSELPPLARARAWPRAWAAAGAVLLPVAAALACAAAA